MSIYQELQLNQAGSKALIKNSKDKREKRRHIFIYIFKVFLTLAFCMAFVTAYTKIFGEKNSVAGVVVLLTVMVFRSADLGVKASHGSDRHFIWGSGCGAKSDEYGISGMGVISEPCLFAPAPYPGMP